jgi:micrococcal nuclease
VPGPRTAAAVAVAVAVVLSAGCGSGRQGTGPASVAAPATGTLPSGVDAAVKRVVDGDTIELVGGERVRFIGMDTPETVDPKRPVGCYGKEASRFTSSLLPPGTPVRMVGDVEQRDRYGRLLAYVYRRADALFVNAELLRRGFAQVLTIPPNVAHTDEFVAIARQAREGSQGLWGACTLLPDGKVAPAA